MDPRLAWEALLQAFEAAVTAGQLASGAGTAEVLQAVRAGAATAATRHATAADLALDGFAALDAERQEKAGVARLRQATALAVARQCTGGDRLRDVLR